MAYQHLYSGNDTLSTGQTCAGSNNDRVKFVESEVLIIRLPSTCRLLLGGGGVGVGGGGGGHVIYYAG